MENVIKPDKKYYTAQLLILSTLSSIIIVIGALVSEWDAFISKCWDSCACNHCLDTLYAYNRI